MSAPRLSHIKETCLYVHNLEKSRIFYEEILGFQRILFDPEKYLFLKIGQDALLLFKADVSKNQTDIPAHFGSGQIHVAFESSKEEYDKWKNYLFANNISIEFEKEWPGGGKSFYFRDPDKLCLEIVQPGIWGF